MRVVTNERSRSEGMIITICGIALTGLALWATATGGENDWLLASELLKISVPTCGLGLLIGTGIIP